MSNKYAKIVSNMNLNNYVEMSDSKVEKLDKMAMKLESKSFRKWNKTEIENWTGLWFYSSLYYNEPYETGNFQKWYGHYRAKLMELWVKEKEDLDYLLELKKFARVLDNLKGENDVAKCKQFIIKMIELLGFNSLLIIGI